MKKLACKTCKAIVEEGQPCPVCKKNSMTGSFQGRVHFLNPEKSIIAKKMAVEKEGEYAIKVR